MIAAIRTVDGGRVDKARTRIDASADARAQFLDLAEAELDRLYRLAGLVLSNSADAEDAVGDALLRGWQAADSLRSDDDFGAWLDRILVNVCRDRLRRRSRIRFIALEVDHDRPGTGDEFRDLAVRDEIGRALADLPPEERLVILLHYWADLTLEAVGQRLDWPVGTVKSRLNRALGRIRAGLEVPERTR
jgi:RNA polymerase sigma-70 factor, ECF subfamily